ncbi:MAG TPA: bifunctional UDP-N-acetylglucosamine diphosphorylase/glucosamine-1-phosphate N-acetyltransferase GlmU [bacterium]|jgi:bifunctional UDP-N-acetylglucosamine pyrophosphorylase/glucosamine-1-phosphate N-acetyltransferase
MAAKKKTDTAVIIMMAGMGTRMKSAIPKVLHHACGQPLGKWVIDSCRKAGLDNRVIVVGHEADTVSATFPDEKFELQSPQHGTGHAVMVGMNGVPKSAKNVLILSGDVPCLQAVTISNLIKHHEKKKLSATVLSFFPPEPSHYGRMIRDENFNLQSITESKDLKGDDVYLEECNSGIYVFNRKELDEALGKLKPNEKSGEYHLPDVLDYMLEKGLKIDAVAVEDWMEAMGVNNRVELSEAGDYLRWKIAEKHMLNGVTITDVGTTWIGPDVKIGKDSTIMPGTIIMGQTKIGEGSVIGPYTQATDVSIGKYAVIRQSVLLECQIDDEVTIGPFAHIRPKSRLHKKSHVGNFVEMKKTDFGEGSKSGHLTYLGDTIVGKDVNIGAGTITCNYDGKQKNVTEIGDGTFVGSDSILVAPIKIGKNAYTAAGSTLNQDVPSRALAFGRARQLNKKGWVK